MPNSNNKENKHAATSEEDCEEIAQKYEWKLLLVEETGQPILSVDCVFEGEQTSFQDTWDDHQD